MNLIIQCTAYILGLSYDGREGPSRFPENELARDCEIAREQCENSRLQREARDCNAKIQM